MALKKTRKLVQETMVEEPSQDFYVSLGGHQMFNFKLKSFMVYIYIYIYIFEKF
jgi:hypothetical protein